ncbi:MAG: Hpt domain-containing protein [Candidatus Competibacteraceae bacterium]
MPWPKSAPCSGLASSSVLGKIIGLYLDSAPALLQRVREAVAAGNGEALRQAAHSFKSSSANLGAMALANGKELAGGETAVGGDCSTACAARNPP